MGGGELTDDADRIAKMRQRFRLLKLRVAGELTPEQLNAPQS